MEDRPGMPAIMDSGEPKSFANAGVGAPVGNGASFAAEFLNAFNNAGQQAPTPAPQPVPAPPQPVPVPNAPLPAPQPVPVVAPVDQSFDRYGQTSQSDPLSGLEQLPALEPMQDTPAPQNMDERAGHAFAELKAKMKAERKRAEDLLGKYNSLVESTKGFVDEKALFADQLNQKDSQIKQLEDDLGKIELSRSPAFRDKYDVPIDRACAEIADVLERNGVSKDEAARRAFQLVTIDPGALSDAVASLPAMAQGEIGIRARDARKIIADREAELNEWRKSQVGLEEVSARDGDIRYAQHMAEMADQAMGIIRGLAPDKGQVPAYAVVDPDFVADREAREARFKDWLSRAPEDQRYAAMFEGFMAPKTYEMLQQTMAENMQLKQQLSARMGVASPRSFPTTPHNPPPAPPPKPAAPQGYSEVPSSTDAMSFAGQFLQQMMQ